MIIIYSITKGVSTEKHVYFYLPTFLSVHPTKRFSPQISHIFFAIFNLLYLSSRACRVTLHGASPVNLKGVILLSLPRSVFFRLTDIKIKIAVSALWRNQLIPRYTPREIASTRHQIRYITTAFCTVHKPVKPIFIEVIFNYSQAVHFLAPSLIE